MAPPGRMIEPTKVSVYWAEKLTETRSGEARPFSSSITSVRGSATPLVALLIAAPVPVYTHEWSVVSVAKLKNAAFTDPAAKARAAQPSRYLFIQDLLFSS